MPFWALAQIGRIRIVQKTIIRHEKPPLPRTVPLSDGDAARIDRLVEGIEDERLRASLVRLGRAIATSKR